MLKKTILTMIFSLLAGSAAHAAIGAGCVGSFKREVRVTSSSELQTALTSAVPGDLIIVQQGTYKGRFVATQSGTSTAPIGLCADGDVVLDGGSTSTGYTLYLKANYNVFSDLRIRNGKQGLVLDGGNYNILTNLEVYDIGQEAVHFRTHSANNILKNSLIHNTGLVSPGYGEGVYIGSAKSNFCTYTNCDIDKSDYNKVVSNRIYDVRAEPVDIKEGTTGTLIENNDFDGSLLQDVNYADSWIDAKGNDIIIRNNRGANLGPKMLDGYQTHMVLDGWSKNILFANNSGQANVNGYGINVDPQSSGVVVECTNSIANAKLGLSNITCQEPVSAPTSTNLATLAHVQSSSALREDHPLSYLFDGCTKSTCTAGTNKSEIMEVAFDFKSPQQLSSLQVYGDADGNWVSVSMDILYKDSAAGSYITLKSGVKILSNDAISISLGSIKTQFIKVRIYGKSGTGAVEARELKIFGKAVQP